jgi:hypothetical protein
MTHYRITGGSIGLDSSYSRYDFLGAYPRQTWDIEFLTDEDVAYSLDHPSPSAPAPAPDMHPCKRCKRACKARFTHCYRCHKYLEVKARIAKEMKIA